MRDYSQIDLIDMSYRKRDIAASNDNSQSERSGDSPVVDGLGARKPLHLILMACSIIVGVQCLVHWLS